MTLPIDRTALVAAQSNQVPNALIRSAQNIAAIQTPYDAIDELYNYTTGLVSASTLSRLGIINVMDYNASGSTMTTAGSITSGLKALTVVSTSTFSVGQGINLQGVAEVASLEVTAGASSSSNCTVTLNGVAKTVALTSGWTATQVATAIRAATYEFWTAGGSGTTVTFTAKSTGTKTDAAYSAGTTSATGTMTTTTQGVADQITSISAINGLVITIADNALRTIAAGTIQHDDTAAFVAAFAAGAGKTISIPVPVSAYRISSTLTTPDNTRFEGGNKETAKILKTFNGNLVIPGNKTSYDNIYFEGDGANYSGKCFNHTGTNGDQFIGNCKIINFSDNVGYFETLAGSRTVYFNCEAWQTLGVTTSGKYAFAFDPAQNLAATPRIFIAIEFGGMCSFDFGGCNGVEIYGSYGADLKYGTYSAGAKWSGGRILNQTALTMYGNNNCITGAGVHPQITVASGANNNVIANNLYNNAIPIIDNSGSRTNYISHPTIDYTPVLTSAAGSPTVGNGSLIGEYARNGSVITATINFQFGSTSSLGSGAVSFSLPYARYTGDIAECGTIALNISGTFYLGFAQIAGAASTFQPIFPSTGSFTASSPGAMVNGNTIRMTITYSL